MELENLTKTTHLSPNLSYRLPDSFFNIVDFTSVIQNINDSSIQKISQFNTDLNFKNIHHKKYIFHYFIYYTCEILKAHNKKYKPVIYFDATNSLNIQYSSFLNIFSQKFPVIILKESECFKDYKKRLKCNGMIEELNIVLMGKLAKIQTKKFYFNKLHYFCKRYQLTFLDKTYFNDIRNKLSLL